MNEEHRVNRLLNELAKLRTDVTPIVSKQSLPVPLLLCTIAIQALQELIQVLS